MDNKKNMNALCPICGINKLGRHPQISRHDNKTPVCPSCWMAIALGGYTPKTYPYNRTVEELENRARELGLKKVGE